jgi:hypothetical protein
MIRDELGFVVFMRRLIASIVLCLLAWGPLSPLAVSAAGDPIPECCRRGGKHHCMMAGVVAADDGSTSLRTTSTPCPYRSQRATAAATPQIHKPTIVARFILTATRLVTPAFVVRRSQRLASMPQRGPPEIPTTTNS